MSVATEPRTGPAQAGADKPAADENVGAVLDAGMGLFASLRRVVTAFVALLAAEAQVLRASVALVFLCSVALVAFSVSLWVCIVALIGWALAMATHSVGIALAILVVLHLILVVAIWLAIKRAIHHASFPQARAEFSALRQTLQRDVARFQHASAAQPSQQESTS